MAKKKFDELNILSTGSEDFDYQDYIDHYFDPMQIDEKQKKERIEAAEELLDAVLFFLIWCENAPERVEQEDTQRFFENLYKEVVYQHADPDEYIDKYVHNFIPMLITTTLDHMDEEYYTSVERATNVACNESNSVCNYSDIQEAENQGYTHKQWLAELDERTRADHIEMNGTIVPINSYFIFDDCRMLMAHDEVNGTARQCVNCRCSTKYLIIQNSGALNGAYNDVTDPFGKEREKIALNLYSEIKNRKKEYEIEAVARNSGYSYEDIEEVYNHVFIREHLFEDGSTHRFNEDYYMANSWLRIRNNDNIQEHDLMMIKHELEEAKIMGDSLEIPYEIAHNEVEIMGYSYQKLLKEYLKTHDV